MVGGDTHPRHLPTNAPLWDAGPSSWAAHRTWSMHPRARAWRHSHPPPPRARACAGGPGTLGHHPAGFATSAPQGERCCALAGRAPRPDSPSWASASTHCVIAVRLACSFPSACCLHCMPPVPDPQHEAPSDCVLASGTAGSGRPARSDGEWLRPQLLVTGARFAQLRCRRPCRPPTDGC